jgi:hypothetical protein
MKQTTINHKYDIGDEVWTISEGEIIETEILNYIFYGDGELKPSFEIEYDLYGLQRWEEDLYPTEAAALEALESNT